MSSRTMYDTPTNMVYSAISLLPTMEQGAHLVGVGSSLPSLSEDEEDDDGGLLSFYTKHVLDLFTYYIIYCLLLLFCLVEF